LADIDLTSYGGEDYTGLYKISNFGRVKSNQTKKTRILKNSENSRKYLIIHLSKNNKGSTIRVHRLVAIHFISNPCNKPQVNHLDGNKQNNYYKNLEWVTKSENEIHAHKIGLKNFKGERSLHHKLAREDVFFIRENKNCYNQYELAKMFNVAQAHINSIINRKSWRCI
jgi:hypothetical protein